MKPVVFILGASALPLARQIKDALAGEIHGPNCVAGPDYGYAKASASLAELFEAGRPIIGVCASGILIRALAPLVADKRSEPPVIALSEDGASVVPLLGGHHGANALARAIAALTGGHAAITTASDVKLGLALDEPPDGYSLSNPEDMKAFVAAVLAGGRVRIEGQAPWLSGLSSDASGNMLISITDRALKGSGRHLVYNTKTLAVGLGCERGTSQEEVATLIADTLRKHDLSEMSIACYSSIDIKEDEPAINGLGAGNVLFFTAEELRAESFRIQNPSSIVELETGTPSVAEAAALAAAGPSAELIVAKTKSRRATCAIARASSPLTELRGRPRGTLSVVGIGPGAAAYRGSIAERALVEATDWVGYDLYLDLVARTKTSQVEHRFPLGAEEDRVRHAISLARQGKQVALVCSGDAGIYAMASLVFEILDLEPSRIGVEVIPGISAFQAAAAKAGAMIGHDFCCISLSDLLTPWSVIENRVKAAAAGDFVVSFYNPRSLKRRDQLERAMAILGAHRPPQTPVVIASNLGRADEKVRIVELSSFDANEVDMLTLVMVGSSQSRSIERGDGRTYAYTPRGYAKKREAS